jgi:hypothetical protein
MSISRLAYLIDGFETLIEATKELCKINKDLDEYLAREDEEWRKRQAAEIAAEYGIWPPEEEDEKV